MKCYTTHGDFTLVFTYGDPKEVGRKVFCNIYDGDRTTLLGTGVAVTHYNDTFNKVTGRRVALTKALANAKLNRDVRSAIWMDYHARKVSNKANA